MSRKAKEVSEISQVYFKARRNELITVINWVSSSLVEEVADTVVDVATVEFRFGAVVLTKKLVFDKIYETIGVAEYHFALLKAINFSTSNFLPHGSGVMFPWVFSSIHPFHLHNDKFKKDQRIF